MTTSEQQAVPVAQEPMYLIRKNGMFYRPNAQGYACDAAYAGRFTLSEAIRHSHPNGPDGPRDGIDYIPTEEPAALPLPCKSGEGAGEAPGMKPWAGGDAAPVDWDGGPVVLRNGSTMFPSNVSLAYHANGTNRWNHQRENRNPDWDIIAYSAALTPDTTQTREAELAAALEFYADRDSDGYRVDVTNYGLSTEEGEIVRDGGARARAALNARGGA